MKVIIVGGGQVGLYLASLLLERGHEIRVIEPKDTRVDVLRRTFPDEMVVQGSGTDPKLLEAMDIRHTDVVAAVTGTDETNLTIATLARLEYGVGRVIGRVNNPKNKWLYTQMMGVDAAVNQADLLAHLVAEEMAHDDMITLLKLHGGEYALIERIVQPESPIVGKAVRDMALPQECVLVAVIRSAGMVIPRGDTVIMAQDKVVAITRSTQMQTLDDIFGTAPH